MLAKLVTSFYFYQSCSGEDESQLAAARRANSRCFWLTGRRGVTFAEAAELILEEARDTLQKDMGLDRQIDWDSPEERKRNLSLAMERGMKCLLFCQIFISLNFNSILTVPSRAKHEQVTEEQRRRQKRP